jgi:hypothetical protein
MISLRRGNKRGEITLRCIVLSILPVAELLAEPLAELLVELLSNPVSVLGLLSELHAELLHSSPRHAELGLP